MNNNVKNYNNDMSYYLRNFSVFYWLSIGLFTIALGLYFGITGILFFVYISVLVWVFLALFLVERKSREYPHQGMARMELKRKKMEMKLEKKVRKMKKTYKNNVKN